MLLDNLDQSDDALKAAETALEHVPQDSVILFNIGNILGKRGEYEKAEFYFKAAIDKEGDNSMYYTNLGKTDKLFLDGRS